VIEIKLKHRSFIVDADEHQYFLCDKIEEREIKGKMVTRKVNARSYKNMFDVLRAIREVVMRDYVSKKDVQMISEYIKELKAVKLEMEGL
jgi:hypothetical protein